MREALASKLDLLEKYPAAVKDAIMTAQDEGELVDVLGTLVGNTRRVNEERRLAQTEVLPTAAEGLKVGDRYTVEVKRAAKRTFNTPSIMRIMQENGVSFLDLLHAGVFTVSWRWTDLKRYAEMRGIKLIVEAHEVPAMGDPDNVQVGEVWGDGNPKWTPNPQRTSDDA